MCSNTQLSLTTLRAADVAPRFLAVLENLRYLCVTPGEPVDVLDMTADTVLFEIKGLPGKQWELPRTLFTGMS
jgi:hypothetical protein